VNHVETTITTSVPNSEQHIPPVKEDVADVTSDRTTQSPSVMYQHLSYFQNSVLHDDDTDEEEEEEEEEDSSSRNGDMDDKQSDSNRSPSNQTWNDNSNNDDGYQIMICGAKGVGKSTCLRYCINQLLNVSTYVMVLDADLGQPEYTTPGMVQLTLIHHTTPNTVPPHISQLLPILTDRCIQNDEILTKRIDQRTSDNTTCTNPEETTTTYPMIVIGRYYFGSITSASDPISYMQCIESLLKKYKDFGCKWKISNIENDIQHNDETTVTPIASNRNHCHEIPLLINLDGWTKDLGYEILTTLIQETFQLRHVIQISGNTASKLLNLSDTIQDHNSNIVPKYKQIHLHKCDAYNIRPTTTTSVAANTTLSCTTSSTRAVGDSELDDDVDDNDEEEEAAAAAAAAVNEAAEKEVLEADIPDNDKSYIPTTSIIPASILRDIRLITYFMQLCMTDVNLEDDEDVRSMKKMQHVGLIWDTIRISSQGIDDTTYCTVGNVLATAKPYVISIDAIRIHFTITEMHNDITTYNHIMDAINGTLVGLCHYDGNKKDTTETSTVLFPCLGLGLVRAIDRNRRLLFVITPLDITTLQAVNCLTIGSNLHLPVQCYFRGPLSEAFLYQKFAVLPPTSTTVPILGSNPMKSRNTINRRGRVSGGGL
jgi:polynucleotide 5'-hydroxyl-kinase GRC3/NOL9